MGKPGCGNAQSLLTEYIGKQRHTRGTETSKYPEEEKTIVIPSVAASERGLAQTKELAPWGCRTSHMELQRCWLGEEVWKGPLEEVKAL
ncbi:hypothetical protein D3C84_753610 [compost metagenome]